MFKIGDMVRILEGAEIASDEHKVGDILVVEDVYSNGRGVDAGLPGAKDWFYYRNEELELVKIVADYKFKVGDKVVKSANVTNSADDHGAGWTTAYKQFLKGDVCEVTKAVLRGPYNDWDYLVKGPNGDTFGESQENLELHEETKAPIASDGGSSSYYDKEIPQWLLNRLIQRNDEGKCFIKTEELIEVLFRNDFSFGNAFKALVRADGVVTGQGKAGNTLSYETTKVQYYANRILEQGENK